MKEYAVGQMCYHVNNLVVKTVKAETWKGALAMAFPGYEEGLSDDLETAKEEAFSVDWLFDVVEIPSF